MGRFAPLSERPLRKPLSEAAAPRERLIFTRENQFISLKYIDISCGLNLAFMSVNGPRATTPQGFAEVSLKNRYARFRDRDLFRRQFEAEPTPCIAPQA